MKTTLQKQYITFIYLQIWQKEGASLEARCQQAGTHLVGLNYIYSNQISFARLNPDESHDYCNRQSEFTEDPKSDLFSILDKMEQFRKILKQDKNITCYPSAVTVKIIGFLFLGKNQITNFTLCSNSLTLMQNLRVSHGYSQTLLI